MNKKSRHMQVINKRNHPHIQPVRDLQIRNERERKKLFFVDGFRFVYRAFRNGAHIERLIVAPGLAETGSRTFGFIEQLQRKGVPVSFVTADVYNSLCTSEDSQGFGAVVRHREHSLYRSDPAAGTCWLALSSIRSPGNLGTIMRSAEAVSTGGIIIIGSNVDPFHPATVRASMGSIFNLRLVRTSLDEFSRWTQENDCFVVGSSPSAKLDYRLVSYPPRTILFVGDERKGLNDAELGSCAALVSIPMASNLDSLNVSIATSILLYEIYNQAEPPRVNAG